MPLSSTPSASASTARFYWDDMEGHDDESNASTNDRQPLLMMRSTESPTSNIHPSVNPFDRISSTSVSSPLPGYSPPRASGQYSQDIAGWSSENSAPTISMSRQVHPSSRRYPDINVPQQRNSFSSGPNRHPSARRNSRIHWDDKDDDHINIGRGNTIKIVLMPVSSSDNGKRGSRGKITLGVLLLISSLFFIYLPFSFLATFFHPPMDWSQDGLPRTPVPRPPLQDTSNEPVRTEPVLEIPSPASAQCVQTPLIPPTKDSRLDAAYDMLYERLAHSMNASYNEAVAEKLAGLIRIQTEAFDDQNGIPIPTDEKIEDPDTRRKGFNKVREYISSQWPLINGNLKSETVNRYGILLRWSGSDAKKRPVLLTAHLDTVPVPKETLSKWTYPPFSGKVADGYVWGRGAHDCKAQVVEILEALENLIRAGFKPTRTILVAFGFDEEIGGMQGAKYLSARIRDLGYHQGVGGVPVALLIDEGSGIYTSRDVGLPSAISTTASSPSFASVSTSEKGYMDLSVSVRVPGGHSSAPPKHTGIGIAAMVVEALESRPLPLALPGALVEQLGCWNEFGAVEDEGMKKVINDVVSGKGGEGRRNELVDIFAGLGDKFKAMLGTTQAVDVIQGGIKVNSLPEQVTVTVNYRIASGSTVSSTEDHVLTSLQSVASLQNLTLVQTRATRSQLHIPPPSSILSSGTLSITTLPGSFDPSPVAPSTSKTFQRISSAIRRTLRNSKSETLVVHPAQGLGNTDTPHYSALVKDGAIYRFSPLRGNDRVHTVDERANVGDVVAASGFFFDVLRGVDGDDEI